MRHSETRTPPHIRSERESPCHDIATGDHQRPLSAERGNAVHLGRPVPLSPTPAIAWSGTDARHMDAGEGPGGSGQEKSRAAGRTAARLWCGAGERWGWSAPGRGRKGCGGGRP
ncbi:hypothetical protein, partial [Streptomyces sp. NPDC056672]|uniref:hypothetical protein n=1 Tax=Streptomyces sp. NPDC056672 TaxID=3345906 RepID=UPI00369206B9